jgi:tape measure domain-containing protein
MAAARTITPVNIRLGVDVTKIKEGMQVTSTELRNLSRLTAQSADGMTKLSYATDLYNKFVDAGKISSADKDRILESLAKKYGVVTEAARKAADAEKKLSEEEARLNESRRQAQSIIKSMQTDFEKFTTAQNAITESHKRGELAGVNLGEVLRRLRVQYDQLTPAERAEAEALDAASKRMKEYERIINSTTTGTDAFDRKLASLNTQLHKAEITTTQYKAAVAALRAEYGVLTGSQLRFQALQERGKIAGEEMIDAQSRLRVVLERGHSITMKYSTAMNQFSADMRAGRISALEFAAAMRQLQSELDDEEKVKKAGKTGIMGTLISPRALATGAAFAAVGAAVSGARGMMSVTMAQEEIGAMTKALTGNDAATKQLLASYRMLDKQSMLSFSAFGEAGKQMLAVGMSTTEITPMLEGLGKVSGGNEERFHSLVRAMTQVQTAGRLTASEMLQFTNAGWSPLSQIAKRAGETMAETKKRIEAGAVSVREVKLALMDATTAGGAFVNVNEEMQQTLTGQWAKFKSDVQAGAIEVGTNLVPAMQEFLSVVKGTGEALPVLLSPITGYIKFASMISAFRRDGIRGVNELLDKYDELDRDQKFAEEVAKRKNQTQQEFLDLLKNQSSYEKQQREADQQRAAFNKEIVKLEEDAALAIEKKWYKAKYGEEAEIQRIKDKIALEGRSEKLHPQEQMRLNERRIAETKMMEQSKERNEKQQKMMDAMRHEVAATEELIRLRKGGLVVSEEDLKKHEKIKEFGNSAAKAEYERMYNRKIALDTEEKRLKEIQADAKKNQEKFQRPEVSFQENVAKLMSQRKLAGLTPDAFEGAGMDLAKSFLQAMNPQNVSASAAPTLRAGSVEAYKFIQEQNERRAQRAEQKALFDRMVKALEQQLEQNKNAPRLAMAGRG